MIDNDYMSEAEYLYDEGLGEYGDLAIFESDEDLKSPKKTRLECKQTDHLDDYNKIQNFVFSEQKRLGYSDKWGNNKFCELRSKLHTDKAKKFKQDKEELTKIINVKKECVVACKCCGVAFVAKNADRKRGWGKFCSKSCKAQRQY